MVTRDGILAQVPITRAVLKNQYCNISQYLLSWYTASYHDPCIVMCSVLWSPYQYPLLKFTYVLCFHVFSFSVLSLSARVRSNVVFYVDVVAATKVCLVICQYRKKLERKFWMKLFWFSLSDELHIGAIRKSNLWATSRFLYLRESLLRNPILFIYLLTVVCEM